MAVAEEREWWSEEEEEESPRNWKSARRRSAHLLAKQIVGGSFWGFRWWRKGRRRGVEKPMPKCLRVSIGEFDASA